MLRGMGKIFSFTFTQQVQKKGYRTAIVLGVLICLLVPIIGMALAEKLGGDSDTEDVVETNAKVICAVDLTEPAIEDFSFLNDLGMSQSHFIYRTCSTLEEAKAEAAKDSQSLIGVLDHNASGYVFSLVLPDGTDLTQEDADNAETLLTPALSAIPMQKSGLGILELQILTQPLETKLQVETADGVDLTAEAQGETEEVTEEDGADAMRPVVTAISVCLTVMVLYFLVLFYGQAAARQVVLEKSSKLMDTFLIAVRPEAMIFGKVLAEACSSILQIGCWIVALIGGFAIGSHVVLWINPDSTIGLLQLFSALGGLNSFLSIPGAILALFVILAGFLLYCGLASVGGAIAGKDEDLANTNVLFTLVLIASFFAVLYGGNLADFDGSTAGIPMWQNLVPFTALLVVPGQLLAGAMSLPAGLLSLGIILLTDVVLMYLAGRIYRMMALYKGEVPKLSQVFGMLLKR